MGAAVARRTSAASVVGLQFGGGPFFCAVRTPANARDSRLQVSGSTGIVGELRGRLTFGIRARFASVSTTAMDFRGPHGPQSENICRPLSDAECRAGGFGLRQYLQ